MVQKIVLTSPGEIVEMSAPEDREEPEAGEVVVEVQRVGLCGTDYHAFRGEQPLFRYPRVLGHELAGRVIGRAPDVDLPLGAAVAVIPYMACGQCRACRAGRSNCCRGLSVMGVHRDGGLTSRITVDADHIFYPADSQAPQWDHLVGVEPLAIGMHAVERAGIDRHDQVVVVGAGPIGLAVLVGASHRGANVYLLERDPARRAFAMQWVPGTQLMDPDSPLHDLEEALGEDLASVVVDCTGSGTAMEQSLWWAGAGGRVVFVGITEGMVAIDDPLFHQRELTVMASRNATREDFEAAWELIRTGRADVSRWVLKRYGISAAGLRQAFADWGRGTREATGVKMLLEAD